MQEQKKGNNELEPQSLFILFLILVALTMFSFKASAQAYTSFDQEYYLEGEKLEVESKKTEFFFEGDTITIDGKDITAKDSWERYGQKYFLTWSAVWVLDKEKNILTRTTFGGSQTKFYL